MKHISVQVQMQQKEKLNLFKVVTYDNWFCYIVIIYISLNVDVTDLLRSMRIQDKSALIWKKALYFSLSALDLKSVCLVQKQTLRYCYAVCLI